MSKKVIFGVMDWGLGHATRSIPIIEELLSLETDVLIASSGNALAVLHEQFPKIRCIELPAYEPTYSSKSNQQLAVLLQSPQILRTIKEEYQILEKWVNEEQPDFVISDNRYGFYHGRCKSVFIGHQLHIKTGNTLTEKAINKIQHKWLQRFDEIWVPDFAETPNLSGSLSHPEISTTRYIQPLSRFSEESRPTEFKHDVLAILSGPEPQRGILESKICEQLVGSSYESMIVRGLPGESDSQFQYDLPFVNYADADELFQLVNQSRCIICRSGYSSVMDLVQLKRSAILIPTPGQTEQVYLAEHLSEQGGFVIADQNEINLPELINKLQGIDVFPNFPEVTGGVLRNTLLRLLNKS